MKVYIPYIPRYAGVDKTLEAHRFVVLVAHRRFGKTVLAVNRLIKGGMLCRKPVGMFAYVAPFRNQAKQIAWDYLRHYTKLLPGRQVNEQDLCVTLPTGARVRIFGADNADALRGLYFDGVVLDEVAQMRREVWQEIVRPALADRGGWALFIGTPKGGNLFHDLYLQAQADTSGEWAALMYRVTDTKALPPGEVERMRAEMSESAFRQEFLCDFSASADDALITLDEATAAAQRAYAPQAYEGMPLVMGVDVARFGDDRTVVFPRRGLVAERPTIIAKADNVTVAERIISLYHERRPHSIFVDAGQGQGVIDIVRRALPCVYEIPFGGQALDAGRFYNRRSEMWFSLREWIREGGALPDGLPELVTELTAPTYGYDLRGRISLEKKEDIKARLGKSPDLADALALTFALPVLPESVHDRQEYVDMPANLFAGYELELGEIADGVSRALL